MNGLVSVIIPVYNTAQYLDMCLQSVVNQTYKKLQIILVDDGSTDGASSAKCDEWCQKDTRIQVIHKSNEGLGYTRNAGLRVAEGAFVCFLDSDDTIDTDTIMECVKTLREQEADACFYGRKTQKADGTVFVNSNIPAKLIYTGEEIGREFVIRYFGDLPNRTGLNYIQASACCAMYARGVIAKNNISFRSERDCLSEDTFFNLEICKYARKVVIIPQDFYNYTYNVNSLTKKYNPLKFNQFKNYYQLLREYSKNYVTCEDIEVRIGYAFYIYLRQVIEYEVHAHKLIGLSQVHENIRAICNDRFVVENLKNVPMDMLDKKRKMFLGAIKNRNVVFLISYYLIIKRK